MTKEIKHVLANSSFRVEADFYGMARNLRIKFEERMDNSASGSAGLTPLNYAYCENSYQFLTASAERFFAPDLMQDFFERLRFWATETLGVDHVSTPQVRVYVKGCSRDLLADNVTASWHYIHSLGLDTGKKGDSVRVLIPGSPSGTNSKLMDVGRIIRTSMKFNQLIVHRTEWRYAIECDGTSMNPRYGAVFLDGYIW